MHSHIPKGMVGTIVEVLPDGYTVSFPKALHFDVFFKEAKTKSALVFMRFGDIEYNTPTPKAGARKKALNGVKKA